MFSLVSTKYRKFMGASLLVFTNLYMMLAPQATLAADQAPDIRPRMNFPGSEYIRVLLGVVLGIIALGLIALFFIGLWKLISSIGSKREGGAGMASAQMIGAAIGLVIVFAGTALLNRWIVFLG